MVKTGELFIVIPAFNSIKISEGVIETIREQPENKLIKFMTYRKLLL